VVTKAHAECSLDSTQDYRLAFVGLPKAQRLQGDRIMRPAALKYEQPSRFLVALVGASLFAGCGQGGTGSIVVDAKNPAIRSFKTLEDVKGPKTARTGKKPAGTLSVPRANFQ
jgi:hypothetical protein